MQSQQLLFVLVVSITWWTVATAQDDTPCTSKGGTCYNRNVTDCKQGNFVKGLCPGGAARQCCLSIDCNLEKAPNGSIYQVQVYFINTRNQPSTLYWINWQAQEFNFYTIPARATYMVFTYPGHNWVVRNDQTHKLLWIEGQCLYSTPYISPKAALITDST